MILDKDFRKLSSFVVISVLSAFCWIHVPRQVPIGRLKGHDICYPLHYKPIFKERSSPSDPITIMMATTHYEDDLTVTAEMDKCPKSCRIIFYKNYPHEIGTAHALVFHLVYVDIKVRWFKCLTGHRHPRQLWVWYTTEAPDTLRIRLPVPEENGKRPYRAFNNHFNLTMTYRRDSDVFVPYSYVYGYEELPHGAPPEFPTHWVKLNNRRHIGAVITNCRTHDYNRLATIREMASLGVQIDILGPCGQQPCPGRVSADCYKLLESKYLFFAAFENSICPDYVSEKLFNIYDYDMVPIVIGGANYSSVAPPNSYINVRSFQSAASFAKFILQVASDETAYNKFFEWKKKYRLVTDKRSIFCKLCLKMHDMPLSSSPSFKTQVYPDLEDWWAGKRPCGGRVYGDLV